MGQVTWTVFERSLAYHTSIARRLGQGPITLSTTLTMVSSMCVHRGQHGISHVRKMNARGGIP